MQAPTAIVVMGVAGCGKSTVAAALARRLGWTLLEADGFHSPANVAKMQGGTPLTDEDRGPWLDALAAALAANRPVVLACSALRRVYRERLSGGRHDVRFVYLRGEYATIASRMASRTGHYMPPSLLASQFATLEEPVPEEHAVVVSVAQPVEGIVDEALRALGLA